VDPGRVKKSLDSIESHIEDTLGAGDGLCVADIVNEFVKRAFPDAVKFLTDHGLEFSTTGSGEYLLHQEGGHRSERVYCRNDYTGQAIVERLAGIVMAMNNITVLENHTAINLITRNQISDTRSGKDKCLGAYVLDRETGEVKTLQARVTFFGDWGCREGLHVHEQPGKRHR
jgi:L-aspartate oxidase